MAASVHLGLVDQTPVPEELVTKSMIDGGFGDQTLKTERLGVCQALSFRRERSKRWRCPGWPFPWSPGPAQGQGLVGWHWLRGQGDRAGRWSTEGRRVAPAWVPGRCIHHLRSLCHISLVSALVPLGRGVLGRVRRLTWSPAGRWGGQGPTRRGSPQGPHGRLQPHREGRAGAHTSQRTSALQG